jgi:hypothetical protein
MISTFSRKLEKAESNYTITEKELFAIIKACDHFRHYLLGKRFTLRTDHKSLIYLKTCDTPSSRLLRWALKLQEFVFDVEYIKGDSNAADGLSRICSIVKNNKQKK